jgi:hypothetical protein
MKCMVIRVTTGGPGTVTKGLKKNSEAIPGKHSIDSLQKTASYTWNITRNRGSTAVCNLKPERWGSPLVQEEKYHGEVACDKRKLNHDNRNNNNKPNSELNKLIKNQTIINFIKAQRLSWLGHIHRMDSDRTVNKVYEWKPTAARPQGRPKLRSEKWYQE